MHDLMQNILIATFASRRGGRLRRVFVKMGVEIQRGISRSTHLDACRRTRRITSFGYVRLSFTDVISPGSHVGCVLPVYLPLWSVPVSMAVCRVRLRTAANCVQLYAMGGADSIKRYPFLPRQLSYVAIDCFSQVFHALSF